MAVNWKKPISVPLWAWTIYWALALLGSRNVFSALLAAFLVAYPFWMKDEEKEGE